MIWQLRCWCFLLSVRTGGRFSVIFSTISCCQPFSCLKYAANVKSDKQVLTTGTAKTSCPLLSMSKIQAYRRPASSVVGACGRCAEALSSPQRPTMDVKVTDSYLLGKGLTLEAPLNAGPRPVMTTEGDCTGAVCVWELTDSPGISLQSLRWVPFPTQGALPWAPHTRLLICKPESSHADHSDQAIQPPKHRKKSNQWKPRQTQDHIGLRRPGNQSAHPSCRHPRPLTFPAGQTAQTHQKVFVM